MENFEEKKDILEREPAHETEPASESMPDSHHEMFLETQTRLQHRLSAAENAFEKTKQRFENLKTELGNQEIGDSLRLKIVYDTLRAQEEALRRCQDIVAFIREPTNEDIDYRQRIDREWSNKVLQKVPPELPLRFHGCPIHTARDILSTGQISSTVDRLGYESSWDVEDQVSVTTTETLPTTLHGYTDLGAENYCLPAGCIFAMLPKDSTDAASGDSMIMSNVSFKEEPDRLFSIVTTPENIDRLREWAKSLNIGEEKIDDFDSFLNRF